MKKLKIKKKLRVGKEKDSDIELFNMGSLLQFETHCWQARKQLPKDKLKELFGEKQQWVNATKQLINRNKLKDLQSYISDARRIIDTYSLPFPIKGIHLIPHNNIELVTQKLNEINEGFSKEADKISEQYAEFIEESQDSLGTDFFNMQDYPSSIRDKFYINWRFFDLTLPERITEEVRKQETEKFKNMMNETKQLSIIALREGFADIVNHLTEKLTEDDGKEKRFHQSSIDKISNFFTEFQNKNIFKDAELESIISRAKGIVEGVQVTNLRSDVELQKRIKDQLNPIKDELNKSIKTYRRKMTL